MRESDFGIGSERRSHLTLSEGIGGRLRKDVEDFQVVEIPKHRGSPGGNYLYALVRARNWETNALIRAMAMNLRISGHSISFAGTKDKRAVTEQYFSFKGIESVSLGIPDVEVLDQFAWSNSLRLGDHMGNRFTIRVQDHSGTESVAGTAEELLNRGFPNFFGVQRFGALRGNTHRVGKAIVLGDWEEAVARCIGHPSEEEHGDIRTAREAYDAGESPQKVLGMFNRDMRLEAMVLEKLVDDPDDFVGAIARTPRNLQLMYVHAFGSYIFNQYLTKRLEMDALSPQDGDLVAERDSNGVADIDRTHIVSGANIEKITERCDSGKACLLGPAPGTETDVPEGLSKDILDEIMKAEGVSTADFVVNEIPRLTTRGTWRPLLGPLLEFSVEEDAVFRFRLPPGTYATSVMREFLKVDDPLVY